MVHNQQGALPVGGGIVAQHHGDIAAADAGKLNGIAHVVVIGGAAVGIQNGKLSARPDNNGVFARIKGRIRADDIAPFFRAVRVQADQRGAVIKKHGIAEWLDVLHRVTAQLHRADPPRPSAQHARKVQNNEQQHRQPNGRSDNEPSIFLPVFVLNKLHEKLLPKIGTPLLRHTAIIRDIGISGNK